VELAIGQVPGVKSASVNRPSSPQPTASLVWLVFGPEPTLACWLALGTGQPRLLHPEDIAISTALTNSWIEIFTTPTCRFH